MRNLSVTVAIAILLITPAPGAATERIIASSSTATIAPDAACAAITVPKGAKRIPVADGCVVVRQERAGQRSCQFVTGPDSTLADYDRMLELCKRTELP